MYEGMGDMDGFSLEDLAAAEDQSQQQGPAPVQQPLPSVMDQVQQAAQTASQVVQQVPVYTQQWQQWDAQRRAGNIQPLPVRQAPPAAGFPWSKVLVGAGIAAAVVAGVMLYKKRSRSSNSGKKSGGLWQTIGD